MKFNLSRGASTVTCLHWIHLGSYCTEYQYVPLLPSNFVRENIINMLNFVIDIIFAMFVGQVFQQSVSILMGTTSVSLLAGQFLYAYEAELLQTLSKRKGENFAQSIISLFHRKVFF